MKYSIQYITMLTAALFFVACSSDEGLIPEQPVIPEAGENIGFQAIVADQFDILPEEDMDNPTTRSTLNTTATGSFFGEWDTSDKISISDGGALMYTYQPKEGSIDGGKCSFQSKTSASFLTDGGGSEGTFCAFYPADAVLGWKNSTVTAMIYTEQDYTENKENSGVMGPYMAARAETTGGGANASFTFGHICSVIDVNIEGITGETVDAVSLYANSQKSIAGKLEFNASTKAVSVFTNDATDYSFSTQSEMVRVSNVASDAKYVRFYVLSIKQADGFTITVHTTSGNYYTKKSTTSVGNSAVNADYLASVTGVNGGEACLPYYKKYNFGSKTAANVRNMNWMAMIPGNVKFNHLSLPGAHDAATSTLSGSAQCQAFTIAEQLAKGCRALDLRPANNSNLVMYHTLSTGVKLSDAFDAVSSFLALNPTETVFVLIHEEESSHSTDWSNRVWSCVNGYTNIIASHGWQGNLNPCRGKMVVIFRDEYRDGTNNGDLGCGRVGWPGKIFERSIFVGNNGSSDTAGSIICQDDYELSSSSEKLAQLTDMLTNYMSPKEKNADYLFINNTNIAKNLSYPSTTSKNVNEAVLGSSTFSNHTGRFGIMMTDFLFSSTQKGDQMFELIHKQNYEYVYKNRSRCSTTTSGTDTGVDISTDEYADDGTVYVKGM